MSNITWLNAALPTVWTESTVAEFTLENTGMTH